MPRAQVLLLAFYIFLFGRENNRQQPSRYFHRKILLVYIGLNSMPSVFLAYDVRSTLLFVLSTRSFFQYAMAASFSSPTPSVGHVSDDISSGTAFWSTVTYLSQNLIISTSGTLWQVCDPNLASEWRSCKNDYMQYASRSVYW